MNNLTHLVTYIQARVYNRGVKTEKDYYQRCNSVDPVFPLSEAYALCSEMRSASLTNNLLLLESLAKMEGHSKSITCFCSFACL